MKKIFALLMFISFQAAFGMQPADQLKAEKQKHLNRQLVHTAAYGAPAGSDGYLDLIEELLDLGADPNAQDERGKTILMEAAENRRFQICALLLERGANINNRWRNLSAFLFAACSLDKRICTLLLEHGADPKDLDTALLVTTMNPLIEDTDAESFVWFLLSKGAYVNASRKNGYTALMSAADRGLEKTCKLLLEYGADTTARKITGSTALIYAAKKNHKTICSMIVDHQKKINLAVKTSLLCLRRLKLSNQPCPALLYKHFNDLLLKYMEYVPLDTFLEMKNKYDNRAYEYVRLDCLIPSKKSAPEDRKVQ